MIGVHTKDTIEIKLYVKIWIPIDCGILINIPLFFKSVKGHFEMFKYIFGFC